MDTSIRPLKEEQNNCGSYTIRFVLETKLLYSLFPLPSGVFKHMKDPRLSISFSGATFHDISPLELSCMSYPSLAEYHHR